MTRREFLYCTLNEWLDEEERLDALCPACRSRAEEARCACCGAPLSASEGMENPAFDAERYRRLKEGKSL